MKPRIVSHWLAAAALFLTVMSANPAHAQAVANALISVVTPVKVGYYQRIFHEQTVQDFCAAGCYNFSSGQVGSTGIRLQISYWATERPLARLPPRI